MKMNWERFGYQVIANQMGICEIYKFIFVFIYKPPRYWKKPELTQSTFYVPLANGAKGVSGNGYLRTGDVGFIHKGELYIIYVVSIIMYSIICF